METIKDTGFGVRLIITDTDYAKSFEYDNLETKKRDILSMRLK